MAWIAMVISPCPVTRITGTPWSMDLIRLNSSRPFMPGSLTSLMTMPGKSGVMCLRTSSAEEKASTFRPANWNACSLPALTMGSSSTSRILRLSNIRDLLHCRAQFHRKYGTALGRISSAQYTTEFAHDLLGDNQSEPQADTLLLGGEK